MNKRKRENEDNNTNKKLKTNIEHGKKRKIKQEYNDCNNKAKQIKAEQEQINETKQDTKQNLQKSDNITYKDIKQIII